LLYGYNNHTKVYVIQMLIDNTTQQLQE